VAGIEYAPQVLEAARLAKVERVVVVGRRNPWRAYLLFRVPHASLPVVDSEHEKERYGLGLGAGSEHHRAYVGPPRDYDLIAALTAGLLFAAGLRETHSLVDVGCGSLRVGRLLIPYLREGNYYGIEPERRLVEEGIEKELGRGVIELKRPSFRYVSDFSLSGFEVPFDFVMAQSVFSHTYPDLFAEGLRGIAQALAPDGLLFATFVAGEETPKGSGWRYPENVPYRWPEVRRLAREAGLVARRLRWPHPRQRWFVAGRPSASDEVVRLSGQIRPPSKHR